MRSLMLLRHTKSAWPDGIEDHDRPLAKRGLQAGPVMGNYMAREGLLPDFAIVSTARRTRQSWELVQPCLAEPILNFDARIYEAPAGAILDVIHETASDIDTLLLVGHNPGLQELALVLIGEADGDNLIRLREKYPTGGLAVIKFDVADWTQLSAGTGKLERFVTPRSLSCFSTEASSEVARSDLPNGKSPPSRSDAT